MLDDIKLLHEKDTEDSLGLAERQWQQLSQNYDLPAPERTFSNIVHSGMGGSALWAILSTSWPKWKLPFEVTRDYSIPTYVNESTLFIASSYSGNTEETLTALQAAKEKGAYIVVITSGGKLAAEAAQNNYPLISLPKIDKPRYGALYGLRGLVLLGNTLGLVEDNDAAAKLEKAGDFLHSQTAAWAATVPTAQNQAKQIAQELMGRSIVMYAGSLLTPAAHKWKISFNENSKNIAWEYPFPEFNHNEFTGWTSHPTEKPYAIVFLRSTFDHARVTKRFDLSNKLLSGRWPAPLYIDAQGDNELEQLLWTVALGDFVSLYLAFLNGVNPINTGDSDIIEKFKAELGPYES